MKNTLFPFIVIILLFTGCKDETPPYKKADISGIEIPDVDIKRYEKDLFALRKDSLARGLDSLKDTYRFFLGDNPTAKNQLIRMKNYLNDPLLADLYEKSREEYPSMPETEKEFTRMFRYYSHYYPKKQTPEVFTYISGIDYRNPVRFNDSILIIALDMYLGSQLDAYKKVNIPNYKSRYYTGEYIKIDAAEAIGEYFIEPERAEGKFIDYIIHFGKLLYFKDALLPNVPDEQKIKYTKKQLEWCKANEKSIWTFIVENDLLFSGKYNDFKKLLSPGPFTSEFGKQSAPRIGRWIGWQMVRSYMNENPDEKLKKLMRMQNTREILKKSKYKP